jgi:photosystem II stability/assembly factor-like uncharacterized protein
MKSYCKLTFLIIMFLSPTMKTFAQWTLQNDSLFTSAGIKDICIVNSSVVWALAYDGGNPNYMIRDYTRTVDGGNTWKKDSVKATPVIPPDQGITNISAIGADTAWAAAYSPSNSSIGGIYRTNDGGITWTKQSSASININSFPDHIHFWDKNNGVAFCDPNPTTFEIYTTSDGGANWVAVPAASIPLALTGEYGQINSSAVVGTTIWENTTAGRILKSIDMGLHWTVATIAANHYPWQLAFKDANNGLCEVGLKNDTLMRTTDGGTTWNKVPVTGAYLKTGIAFTGGPNPMYVCIGSATPIGSSYSLDDGTTLINIEST